MSRSIALVVCALVMAPGSWAAKGKAVPAEQAPLQLKEIKVNGSDGKDIVAVASGSPDHTTLVAALKAADLVETLQGAGPYTIFAPTNAAFEKLPKGTVESLLKAENLEKLKSILQHHAAAPAYHPNIISGLSEVDMVDGPKLKVTKSGGKLFVDGVEVKTAIAAMNGVIYVIDSVLLPQVKGK